jgi:hypothetical protein
LLCIFIERQAPKTGVHPSLNFSMCAIGVPQSIYSAAASLSPGVRRLHKTNREPRRLDSGPWWMIRWRGRAKPLGVGRCSGSSCVFVCLFVRAPGRKARRSLYLFFTSVLIFYFCTTTAQ